jgi:hypothetical protein
LDLADDLDVNVVARQVDHAVEFLAVAVGQDTRTDFAHLEEELLAGRSVEAGQMI